MGFQPGSMGFPASNWKVAWIDGVQELTVDMRNLWNEIFEDEENMPWDKLLLIFEYPFMVIRKLTVPIPCEGYYCRATVAAAFMMSPIWFGVYIMYEYGVNWFWSGGFSIVGVWFIVCAILGALILRFAPGGDGVMSMMIAVRNALNWVFTSA
jgi:sodium/potassium/calcium exchanger 6